MKFEYPLQKLLELKKNEKTQAQWHLSHSIGVLHQEMESLQNLAEHKNLLDEQMLLVSEKRVQVSEMVSIQEYRQHLASQISQKSLEVQSAEAEVNKRQDIVKKKMVEEKVWDKARDIAYQKYLQVLNKKQQEELDEMAAQITSFT
ncbi:MAG: flagellar export protein FliJ [Paenibacillus sp. RIFOXYA1_FULL_44_5]|nr:MAG: flagellar export protein FliJ [Paenibacillus sp. RIFOXYA1_FULL_44_5]